jgi:hypothetical protein
LKNSFIYIGLKLPPWSKVTPFDGTNSPYKWILSRRLAVAYVTGTGSSYFYHGFWIPDPDPFILSWVLDTGSQIWILSFYYGSGIPDLDPVILSRTRDLLIFIADPEGLWHNGPLKFSIFCTRNASFAFVCMIKNKHSGQIYYICIISQLKSSSLQHGIFLHLVQCRMTDKYLKWRTLLTVKHFSHFALILVNYFAPLKYFMYLIKEALMFKNWIEVQVVIATTWCSALGSEV